MKPLFLHPFFLIAATLWVRAQNPILPDFHADPSARVFDGKLYIYPSHDAPGARNWKQMVDWHVFSSEDMKTWTDHGVAVSLKDVSWAKEEAWSPDCIARNGKYYFYFTAGGQIGVAVSDSPTGPFKDALGQPLVKKGEAGIRYMIDPNVFIDDDGQAYLYVGGGRQLGVVKLKEDMITRDGPLQRMEMQDFYEGAWIHKHDGNYYASYPTRPDGKDSRANVMVYSMARSPLGPWKFMGAILDNHSHNVHGSITEFKGKPYLFYHVEGPSHWERRVCVEPVLYGADGGIKPVTMSPPQPPPTHSEVPYGAHERQKLDVWLAKSPDGKPTPVVIHLHGGAWTGGDKRDVSKTPFEKYLAAGISVVSVNYRYVPQARAAGVKPPVEWPMHDGARAVQFVRSKAPEWNLDKSRVALTGTSAGACTSLWLAFHDDLAEPAAPEPVARESTRPYCAAVNVPQTTLDPQQMREWTPNSNYGGHAFGFNSGSGIEAREKGFVEFLAHRDEVLPWIREYSPFENASSDDPPVYLFYPNQPGLGQAQKDPTHTANFGVKLKERLDSLGVSCELVYPKAPDVSHPDIVSYLVSKLTPAH